jgi:hypothetical protein
MSLGLYTCTLVAMVLLYTLTLFSISWHFDALTDHVTNVCLYGEAPE